MKKNILNNCLKKITLIESVKKKNGVAIEKSKLYCNCGMHILRVKNFKFVSKCVFRYLVFRYFLPLLKNSISI